MPGSIKATGVLRVTYQYQAQLCMLLISKVIQDFPTAFSARMYFS